MALYQTVMQVQSLICNTAKINFVLRLMLKLYVIILEVILKSMTSLGGKNSSMPLKMHQLWSFFIITSFIHERETRFSLSCLTSLFVSSMLYRFFEIMFFFVIFT